MNDERENLLLKKTGKKLKAKDKDERQLAVLNVASSSDESDLDEPEEEYSQTLERIRREIQDENLGSDLDSGGET